MKYKNLKLTITLFCGLGLTNLLAQETINVTGENASGNGGSVSYSIGQLVYKSHTGENTSILEGVQQPYEISVVVSIPEAENIKLSISAYPNPTNRYLTVKVENYDTEDLQYQFFDTNGKHLQTIQATGLETQIEVIKLVPANYFVKVLDNRKEIKVFKIIKR
ncbi:MAG: T9SS type A sorting domain-containing protein [Bacteroidales bacterium]|nr:T9SS type A sorting domain-containing protein [Bacteroidales bacterium]